MWRYTRMFGEFPVVDAHEPEGPLAQPAIDIHTGEETLEFRSTDEAHDYLSREADYQVRYIQDLEARIREYELAKSDAQEWLRRLRRAETELRPHL